jgi:hypothetical protein
VFDDAEIEIVCVADVQRVAGTAKDIDVGHDTTTMPSSVRVTQWPFDSRAIERSLRAFSLEIACDERSLRFADGDSVWRWPADERSLRVADRDSVWRWPAMSEPRGSPEGELIGESNGGGGSRTRVREYAVAGIYMRSRP